MSDKLTEQQTEFVVQYLNSGADRRKAALAAGYSKKGLDQCAYRLLRNPKIQAAIRDEAENHLNTHVALASATLVDLCKNAKSGAVRLQAAQALLDRGGLPLIRQSEHRHVIEDTRTDKELQDHVKQLMGELGLDAKVVNAPVIEHEPTSKEPEPKADKPKQQTED